MSATKQTKSIVSNISFNTDTMDNTLNRDGLDWTFEKPTSKKYSIIYIIEKEEEEDSDDEEYVEHLVYLTIFDGCGDDNLISKMELMSCPKRITEEEEIIEWIENNECCSIDDIKINPKPTDLTICDGCNRTAAFEDKYGNNYCSVECMASGVEDSDDEDCVAHPVYKCDGGCGTIMGSDDDCKRICDDCEEDSDDEEEEIELKVEPPINLWDSLLEQQQKDILKSQSVWKIYFGAVLQDIREPNWREEEKEKKKCRECEVVITKDNIYEPEDFHENCDLCDKCGDYYKECVVCDEWTVEDECYRDKDGDAINLCNVCGDSEYAEIEENVEKINQFVKNYERGEYIGFYSTEIDAIMKFINKFHKRW